MTLRSGRQLEDPLPKSVKQQEQSTTHPTKVSEENNAQNFEPNNFPNFDVTTTPEQPMPGKA